MSDIKLTGNPLLDKLITGPYVKNPNYNPNTKAGRNQPQYLVDTTPGKLNGGAYGRAVNTAYGMTFTNTDLGLSYDEVKEDLENGIVMNPYRTNEELNQARADSQSAFEQFGNFLMQAGVGEIMLGTMEGFGNIYDGVINSFTGDNYHQSAYTDFFQELKEDLNNNFKIHRENANASWDAGDFGWWMQNSVSVASTLSLMLPAAGWAKGLSYVGKLSKANKLLQWSAKGISKGLGKVASKNPKLGNFSAINNFANKPARVQQALESGTRILTQATLSRAGENYMEARSVYDNIYSDSKENLENMPIEEFAKFIEQNPEFKDMSKDDIAKEIARKSANKTFYNDYWMLLVDIPQFKALGSLWGKGAKRHITASERIAAKNAKLSLAGIPEDKLIKNTFLNRQKEHLNYALKNPKNSFLALNLEEGFEELYQGIQSEKGMEVATKYFDPSFTPRSINSYLTDGHIWEQFFWGSLGAIVFNGAYNKVQHLDKTLKGLYNKKHMSAEDYERWKTTEDKIAANQLNTITNRTKEFISDMEMINQGKNPYKYTIDKSTGRKIIKDGKLSNETIDETEQDLLKQEAIQNFVDAATLDAVDSGIEELMIDILGSEEFNKFIEKNGTSLSSTDRKLSQQVADRMKNVADIYKLTLNDVNDIADTTNPYITRAAARNITAYKLRSEIYDNELLNIDTRINEANDSNTDYSNYESEVMTNSIEYQINYIKDKLNVYEQEYQNGLMSKAAYEKHKNNLKRDIKNLLELYDVYSNKFESTKNIIKDINDKELESIISEYDSFIDSYRNKLTEFNAPKIIPPSTLQDLIKQKAGTLLRKTYNDSNIPQGSKDYQELYDEFSLAMDEVAKNRIIHYVDLITDYLRNAEDFDTALNKVLNNNTESKSVNEAASYLKYGYISEEGYSGNLTDTDIGHFSINTQLSTVIESLRKERNKAESRIAEAAKQGVTIPTNAEVAQQEQTKESADTDASPSTGEETKSDTKDTVNPDNTGTITPKDDSPVEGMITENPDEVVVDPSQPIDESDEEKMTDKELEDNLVIAETYASESNKASIEADAYIKKVAFTQINKIEEITKALANGDTSKKDKFIEEIVDYLVSNGHDAKLSKKVAEDSFINMATSFALMDSKNAFAKLVQQLALGVDEDSAKKYSVTELIEGKGVDEIIDKFLEEYNKLVSASKTNNGVSIINIQSLFDYLLNHANVDISTASYVYNRINNFISTHDGSKYKFTGFDVSRNRLTAEDFFNRLKEHKARTIAGRELMHISPIERDKRDENYNKALEAVARGAKSFIREERDSDNTVTDLAVYVPITKGKDTINVKVGILRTVDVNDNLTRFSPVSHYSGFANVITINNGYISLDCDFLFEDLINNHDVDPDTKTLFNDILQYTITVQDIMDRLNKGIISDKVAAKELNESMDEDTAKRILNNPQIKLLLNKNIYKIYDGANKTEIDKAKTIAKSISTILFYGHSFDTSDPANDAINTIAIDKKTMLERYADWKSKVHFNYTHTYELQKGFKEENQEIFIHTDVEQYTMLNTIKNPEDFVNIDDAGFDIDPTSPNYTPLVMVDNKGRIIDENGKQYGIAPFTIKPYSMGFLVNNEYDIPLIGYCNTALELSNSPIGKAIKDELANIITRQLNNINPDTHAETYDNLKNRITELFEAGSLFKFAQTPKGSRIKVKTTSDNSVITIAYANETGERETNLLSLFLKNKDNVTNSNAVGLYIPRLNKQVAITSLKDTKYGNEIITEQEIRNALNSVIDTLTSTVKLNRSLTAMENKRIQGETPKLFTKEDGKFIVHLGNKDYVYNSYADFILQNRGFNTNVDGSANKSFIVHYVGDKITIDTSIKDVSGVNQETNTNVSDLLFNNKNEKRKTVDTKEVLIAAGVPNKTINALLTKIDGVPIVSSKVKVDENYNEDEDTNAYYSTKDGYVYITPKGASVMNNNPMNTIRLILHENLHRLFHNKSRYNDKERERILKELREVYDYTIDCLNRDKNSGKIDNTFYDSIMSVLNKATKSDNEQIRMEEFLVESLTQPAIANYLNNTNYHSEVNIEGIPAKSKSIFQKIMDILLDLLGIKSNRIKNNTILAREYMILSKTANSTTDGMFTKKLDNKNTIDSEQLNKTRKDVDKIREGFESRIKRSPNFKKDHKYVIDGVEADYSVTQKVHGNQDLGTWALPSSLIGNTADEAARQYFNNGDKLTGPIPNVTNKSGENSVQGLEKDLHKIREYLDKRFGKGRYGVITEEFPIGGTIIVNGEEKTIAGTMDMLVYTDTGDIYIFDFKTKRIDKNSNANISENTLNGYSQQVNIYRQLIEANYPEFKGKVHTGGLIKFVVDYPNPNQIEYRENPNVEGQLQVRETKDDEFLNIQDSYVDYYAPFFFVSEDFEKEHIINVENKDYSEEIKALPKINESAENIKGEEIKVPGEDLINDELEKLDKQFDILIDEFNLDIDNIDEYNLPSVTELIEYNEYTEEEQEILRNAPRNAEGKLLAPNGKVSNLNEKQYAQVRTKAFKRWFGDWEKQFVVYQGRNNQLDNRKYNYYTISKDEANDYGNILTEIIIDTTDFLQVYNGDDWTNEYRNIYNEFKRKTGKYFDILNNSTEGLKIQNDFFKFVKSKGYKGLNLLNGNPGLYSESIENGYIVTFENNNNPNTSKVIDENGEPLVVYHGGAKNITEFKTSSEQNSNTGYGYYTDDKTGEKIPFDSNRTIFFSNNKYVGESYATLYAINYFDKLFSKIDSLVSTFYNGKAGIDLKIFKDINDFYNTLDEVSEYNPRFSALKKYIKDIKSKNEKLKPNEVEAARNLFIELRDVLRSFKNDWNMNKSEWANVFNISKSIIDDYNNEKGIQRLINGEIPKAIKNEWDIYKKIESNREKQGLSKISNYEVVYQYLSSRGISSFMQLEYDGNELILVDYTSNTEKRNPISKMSKNEIKEFFEKAKLYNKEDIQNLNNDAVNKNLKNKSQQYSVFLNIKNPLSHDYEGTRQGEGYKFNKKYPFGYVAARQVNKAINEGHDGVIYENLFDPYLANNYGVFNPNQVKSATGNNGEFSLTDNNMYHASTELITDTEIYATPIVNGNTDNSFGIKVVNDINEFIDSFPIQYRESIKQILAENELNYTCQ